MSHNEILICVGLLILSIFLITIVGNEIVKIFLPSAQHSTPNGNGAKIGSLERILYFIGIVFQSWSLIALVLGLKTIARHKKLEEQEFSEYFLIGSFTSLLYSLIISTIFLYSLHYYNCKWLESKLNNIQIVKIVND